jgi:hypothetical protein
VRVQDIGRRFDYPPTPDIAGGVRQQIEGRRQRRVLPMRLRVGVALAIIAWLIVLTVPDLRATAFDWLRIGAVRIARDSPTPAPTPIETRFDPVYATTLAAAQPQVSFNIVWPADLGAPDEVFLYPGQIVILVWATDDGAPLSLHLLDSRQTVIKHYSDEATSTMVNGRAALWLIRPHLFEIPRPGADPIERIVESNVLIWDRDGVTYRLETDRTLEEARRIAEAVP